MRSIQSILVLADRSSEAQGALRKASVLARHFRAEIELFACDTEHGWALGLKEQSPAARQVLDSCLAESHRYLNALRSSIPATDLRISASAACAMNLPEAVAQRVREWHPDLVIKNLADRPDLPRAPQPLEMQLIREASVPMLWIHGRAWRPMPQIMVALDLDSEDQALTREVLDAAECLALGCHGELVLVHCLNPAESGGASATERSSGGILSARARATCDWLGLSPERLRLSSQSPLDTFGVGGAHAQMDVLVLGGVRPAAWERGLPTTTESLLGVLACDVLLVPRDHLSSSR